MTGAATGFFNPAATGLLPHVVPAEGLQPANALRVLQVKPLRGAVPFTPSPDATWGLHLTDANIVLGNLANLVRRQIRAYD